MLISFSLFNPIPSGGDSTKEEKIRVDTTMEGQPAVLSQIFPPLSLGLNFVDDCISDKVHKNYCRKAPAIKFPHDMIFTHLFQLIGRNGLLVDNC